MRFGKGCFFWVGLFLLSGSLAMAGSIQPCVFCDTNGNGEFDAGDTPVEGLIFALYDGEGNVLTSEYRPYYNCTTFWNLNDSSPTTYTLSIAAAHTNENGEVEVDVPLDFIQMKTYRRYNGQTGLLVNDTEYVLDPRNPQYLLTILLDQYYCVETPRSGEGCSQFDWGFRIQDFAGMTVDPHASFNTVFGVNIFKNETTMLQVLQGGFSLNDVGGTIRNRLTKLYLARQGITGLFNASHPLVSYDWDANSVIQNTQAALNSGSIKTMREVTAELLKMNQQGCPLVDRPTDQYKWIKRQENLPKLRVAGYRVG